jgi:hypothetical protein
MEFWFFRVVPNYLNCSTLLKQLLLIFILWLRPTFWSRDMTKYLILSATMVARTRNNITVCLHRLPCFSKQPTVKRTYLMSRSELMRWASDSSARVPAHTSLCYRFIIVVAPVVTDANVLRGSICFSCMRICCYSIHLLRPIRHGGRESMILGLSDR